MEYYSAIKKTKSSHLQQKWMEVEGIMLSKISQTEKDKHRMISLICGRWKKNKDKENSLVVTREEGVLGWAYWVKGHIYMVSDK